MNVKGGTQTWSKAEQTPSLRADPTQTLSADERALALGDQDLGTVLNKVADPNWVDPALNRKVGNSELGKDSFLKLLLAQLKNQDPTNTMPSHEMAAQLAQFSQLEKLSGIEDGIAKMGAEKSPEANFGALNMIGKEVQGDSARIMRATQEDQHDVTYQLPQDAATVEIQVRDFNNEVVKKIELKNLKKGENVFNWNGITENGQKAGEGEYKVSIEAKNNGGQKMGVETAFRGIVSGVNFGPKGPEVMIGPRKLRLKDIKTFSVPGTNPGPSAQAFANGGPAGGAPTGKFLPIAGSSSVAKGPASNNVQQNPQALMDSIGMSSAMKNKIQKETGTNQ